MSELKSYIIHITGHVQGVGFRHSARVMARHLGLKGFTKNLTDGRVYIEAEGDVSSLNAMLEWCRKGPGFGLVKKVEKTENQFKGYKTFDIRY